jgi:antitoxin component YwqK of YwqJK toxin-antitoxin module
MTTFRLFFAAIMFFLIFNSCISKNTRFEKIYIQGKLFIEKKTYDNKGDIISEEILDKDSLRNGFYKEYTRGKIKDSGNYVNGKKEGLWFHWNLAGDLIKIENWLSDKRFGQEFEYYSKTSKKKSSLYKYSFYNLEGQKTFESKFDLD